MIDLPPELCAQLKEIIWKYVPGCEIRIFGSRVRGTARKYSDIDLALVANNVIDARNIAAVQHALSASDIPFMVDIVDWHTVSDSFKNVISAAYEVLG